MTTVTNGGRGNIVIVAYRPKPGKEAELLGLTREHVPYLQSEGLATARIPIVAKAADGTIIEVFEWAAGGVEHAHTHPGVGKMWAKYSAICDCVPLNTLEESKAMFAGFEPLSV
ncbi:MAG: hypothetical protein ABI383_13590 [Acidobacteriaceae bacterium]